MPERPTRRAETASSSRGAGRPGRRSANSARRTSARNRDRIALEQGELPGLLKLILERHVDIAGHCGPGPGEKIRKVGEIGRHRYPGPGWRLGCSGERHSWQRRRGSAMAKVPDLRVLAKLAEIDTKIPPTDTEQHYIPAGSSVNTNRFNSQQLWSDLPTFTRAGASPACPVPTSSSPWPRLPPRAGTPVRLRDRNHGGPSAEPPRTTICGRSGGWADLRGSNPRHSAPQADALPAELRPPPYPPRLAPRRGWE